MLSTAIGFLAGLLTTAANVPQVWKTYRTRSGEGLSFRMLVSLASGLTLWIVYGALFDAHHCRERGWPHTCACVDNDEVDFRPGTDERIAPDNR
jgi:uncharacterized protein with PQ loop repeat